MNCTQFRALIFRWKKLQAESAHGLSKTSCDHRNPPVICAGSGNSERQKEKGSLPSHEYDPGQVMMLLWHYYSQSIASLGCFLWVLESSVDLVERMNPFTEV